MLLQAGEPVARYRALYPLGRGGTAEVWAVEHGVLGTRHALKVLRGLTPGGRERLLREGRIQARLDPTHVVPVTDVVDVAGSPGLVMPLVEGCSLAELLEVHRPSEDEAVALFSGIAAGVAAVHAAGVVHRDLKPGNILLHVASGQVVPRVADFGLARELHASGGTLAGAFLGTPAYAAPEQLTDASRTDARADLWAMGVIFYELLAGRRPFDAEGIEALLYAVHREPPDLGAVPARWRPLLAGLLAADPDDRRVSADEVVQALPRGAILPVGSAVVERVRQRARSAGASTIRRPPGPHNLPPEPNAFFGREQDLVRLRDLVGGSRVVSVLGVGGTGKTRLATRFGWQHRSDWPGGVWFCDLTEAHSRDGVLAAVARALGVPLDRGDAARQLGRAVDGRGRCLIVLDNAEQVAEAVAELIEAWLPEAPGASFLVTTRRRLRAATEHTLPLDPLDAASAAALFTERAATARPGFEPSEEDRAAILSVVALLDGLPLAIELAAARARVLSPARILERLQDRFRVLARRGPADRHASLRATLDDSWDLLTPQARSALARMSVFEGGFDLDAAQAVSGPGEAWAVEVVEVLVDHSLVRVVGPDRFGLLVSVQEYAASKLTSAEAQEAEARHAAWYARLGSPEAVEALRRPGGPDLRRALALELDNLVAAARRASDPRAAAWCALAAWEVLQLQGPYELGLELLEAVRGAGDAGLVVGGPHPGVSSGGPTPGDRVRCGVALGTAYLAAGRPDDAASVVRQTLPLAGAPRSRASLDHLLGQRAHLSGERVLAREHYERALAGWSSVGDDRARGLVERNLGALAAEAGDVATAEAHYERALALLRAAGDTVGEAHVLGNRANLYGQQGQLDRARAGIEEALSLQRSVGNRSSEGTLLLNLGNVLLFQGRPVEARRQYAASLAIQREIGSPEVAGMAWAGIGMSHFNLGEHDEALRCYEAALALHRQVGDRGTEARTLANRADVARAQGRFAEARRSYEEALAVHEALEDRPSAASVLNNLANLHVDAGALEEGERCYERALALCREVRNRRLEGMVLGNFGRLRQAEGRTAEAIALAEEGLVRLREVGDPAHQAQDLTYLGRFQLAAGRLDLARASLEAALALAIEVGNPTLCAGGWADLAALEREDGRLDAARDALERAEALRAPIRDERATISLLCERALLASRLGDPVTARAAFDEARARADALAVADRSPLGQRLARAALVL